MAPTCKSFLDYVVGGSEARGDGQSTLYFGLAEADHLTLNLRVQGSSPYAPTKFFLDINHLQQRSGNPSGAFAFVSPLCRQIA
jgi:hypothetical protein